VTPAVQDVAMEIPPTDLRSNRMNKLLIGGSLAAILAAGVAVAAPSLPGSKDPVSIVEMKQRTAERFKALDANGDGSVTKAEMDSARGKWAGKRGEHAGHARGELFGRADTDKNGIVTRAEFDAAIAQHAAHREGGRHAMMSDADREARAGEMFKRLDADGNGSVSKAEAEAAQARFQQRGEARDERRDDRFAKLDSDGNGAVSLAEFNARDAERIDRLDANHDGQITPDELAAGRAAFRAKHGQRH
jgi:Ca2+-binding EF-hand superfamily protein